MIEIGSARECEMVLAFLRAEVESPRYAKSIESIVEWSVQSAQLIYDANLENESENEVRRIVLAQYRGYGCNSALFSDFPTDVSWRRVELEPREHDRLLYAREEHWIAMSGKTRRPDRLIERMRRGELPADFVNGVTAIQEQLRRGRRYPELIVAEGSCGNFILIEGHTRATAYAASALEEKAKLIVASSPSMDGWKYY
jgi:hypothetical protein